MTPEAQAELERELAAVDQPDLAIRLAYQLHDDRKSVLAEGADLAIGMRSKIARFFAAISPWPTELEAIKAWGGDRFDTDFRNLRAGAFGFTVAYVVITLTVWIQGYKLDYGMPELQYKAAIGVTGVVLGVIARLVFDFGLKHKVARVEEMGALEVVAGELARRVGSDARRAPWAMMLVRMRFRKGAGRSFLEVPKPQRLKGRRTWTAHVEREDPERKVILYRVYLYDGKHEAGVLFAEIPVDFMSERPTTANYKELHKRIAAVAATGHSNVPTLADS